VSVKGVLLAGVAVIALALVLRQGVTNRPAPDFTLPDTFGREVTLSEHRGNPVLLIFWTTWCGVCRHQMPVVDEIRSEYRSQGLQVLGVNLEDTAQARDYLVANRLYLRSAVDAQGTIAQQYGVSGLPTMVLLDGDGKVRGVSAGYRDAGQLRSALRRVGL
jgi:cytochrome c biogenesis protein CcmG, thiol:disulfide interchange protein DsbE